MSFISYDSDVDIYYIPFNNNPVVESEEIADGVIVDYDKDDLIVGVEVMGGRKKEAARREEYSFFFSFDY